MRNLLYIVFISSFLFLNAQERVGIELEFLKSIPLKANRFLGINMYEELFYIQKGVLFKETKAEKFSYQNNLYGRLHNVDLLNSLQVTLFYKDFNTIIQLDRWLGELNKIDFTQTAIFSSITHVSTASNRRFWVFNGDTQQLQVYNPQQKIIEASTRPIQEERIDFYSNFNYCWILTASKLLQYNIYGNLLNSYDLENYDGFVCFKEQFILRKDNQLYFLSEYEKSPKLLKLPKLSIKDFSVTNESLYIYNGKELSSFKINYITD